MQLNSDVFHSTVLQEEVMPLYRSFQFLNLPVIVLCSLYTKQQICHQTCQATISGVSSGKMILLEQCAEYGALLSQLKVNKLKLTGTQLVEVKWSFW
jgi:hypothetical protein